MKYFNLSCLALLILSGVTSSQSLRWSLQTESGYYHNQEGLFKRRHNCLQQLDANLSLQRQLSGMQFQLKTRINPINYSLQTPARSFRTQITSSLRADIHSRLSMAGTISAQDFQYQDRDDFIQYRIYHLSQQTVYTHSLRQGLILNLDWFSRQLNRSQVYSFRIYKTDAIFWFPTLHHSSSAAGFYLENFRLRRLQRDNHGWRYGPQLSLQYRALFEIKIDYRFLFHSSDITRRFSYEQWIRLILGRMIHPRLSLILLLDYSVRNLTVQTQQDLDLLYSPINQENGYFGRLEYDLPLSVPLAIYIKFGYSKNEVVFYDHTLSGFLGLAGFRLKN
ncbi:MAG: hypothetical protein KBA26_12470 [Candidatus Delongbacteria bacterium]|nr:hypothetical protein [Candidatus Delongbacteria bacterium]